MTIVAAAIAATLAPTVASAQDARSRSVSADLGVSVTVVRSCQVATEASAQRIGLSCARGVTARTHVAPAADAGSDTGRARQSTDADRAQRRTGAGRPQQTAGAVAVATIHF
jgi:hypothetical protein